MFFCLKHNGKVNFLLVICPRHLPTLPTPPAVVGMLVVESRHVGSYPTSSSPSPVLSEGIPNTLKAEGVVPGTVADLFPGSLPVAGSRCILFFEGRDLGGSTSIGIGIPITGGSFGMFKLNLATPLPIAGSKSVSFRSLKEHNILFKKCFSNCCRPSCHSAACVLREMFCNSDASSMVDHYTVLGVDLQHFCQYSVHISKH